MTEPCSYAGCQIPSAAETCGWAFCRPHLSAHREVMRSDNRLNSEATDAHVSGFLLPSGSLTALLAVLTPRRQAAA